MRIVCQIAKLKMALDEKEREAAQFKDLANRVTSEMRNARTKSPLTASMSLKPEAGQESSVDTCTSEVLRFSENSYVVFYCRILPSSFKFQHTALTCFFSHVSILIPKDMT
jgi:hypothetical protein